VVGLRLESFDSSGSLQAHRHDLLLVDMLNVASFALKLQIHSQISGILLDHLVALETELLPLL
jgi:hypothetical protein